MKRVYDEPAASDGARYLVDRLWPRGVRKETLKLAAWPKEVAPSNELRKAFCHDPENWTEFRRRYRQELEKNSPAWTPLMEAVKKRDVTLLFAAKDTEMNQATVLKEFLEEKRRGAQS